MWYKSHKLTVLLIQNMKENFRITSSRDFINISKRLHNFRLLQFLKSSTHIAVASDRDLQRNRITSTTSVRILIVILRLIISLTTTLLNNRHSHPRFAIIYNYFNIVLCTPRTWARKNILKCTVLRRWYCCVMWII